MKSDATPMLQIPQGRPITDLEVPAPDVQTKKRGAGKAAALWTVGILALGVIGSCASPTPSSPAGSVAHPPTTIATSTADASAQVAADKAAADKAAADKAAADKAAADKAAKEKAAKEKAAADKAAKEKAAADKAAKEKAEKAAHAMTRSQEQAVAKAEDYLEFSSFSRGGLIDQLKFEGFTSAQAAYGADAVGL